MGVLDSIKGISEEKPNKTVVFMGVPGSGKTTVAGTFPKPMLYVSIGNDGGGVVLQSYTDDEVKTINLANDKDGTIWVKAGKLLDELKSNTAFKTVVFDAWTSIQEEMELFFTNAKGRKLNFDEWDAIGKTLLNLRDKVIDNSRFTETYYVLICHVKDKDMTDTLTNEVNKNIIPKMTGNNGRILLERPNIVAYCCKRSVRNPDGTLDVKFLTYLGAHPNIDTKFRTAKHIFDGVGTYVENCTFDKIMALADGQMSCETLDVVESQRNPFGEEGVEND